MRKPSCFEDIPTFPQERGPYHWQYLSDFEWYMDLGFNDKGSVKKRPSFSIPCQFLFYYFLKILFT